MNLNMDVKYIKGVGPVRAELLDKELGIKTVGDLLYHFPYRYIDRTEVHRISELVEDMPYVQLKGQIFDITSEGEGRKKRLRATFSDGSGWVDLIWFNQIKFVEKNLKCNKTYLLLGKPAMWNGRFSIAHPEMDDAEKVNTMDGTLQALYHTTDRMKKSALGSKQMQDIISAALEVDKTPLQEVLPQQILMEHDLMPLDQAIRVLHRPTSANLLAQATNRMKFEELFFLQLSLLQSAKSQAEKNAGLKCERIGKYFNDFFHTYLPFPLTEAQKRVVREIRSDMRGPYQMNRLLQGDVGSGKTIVALLTCLIAIDNGYQATIMAPTEILAEQHYASILPLVEGLGLRVALLTGNVKGKQRKQILDDLKGGNLDILIGTHALIEPTVVFNNLGIAIIDEQHRFGVKQRAMLWSKNVHPPHILVMTATPIPRTLAMTVYGDLDVSIIDELPPGRKPITTLHYHELDRPKLYDGIRYQLQMGVQVYFVYPLIAESEKIDLKNLEEGFVNLETAFPEYQIGKVHGKMLPAEKDAVMQDFKQGKYHILVSTTVIEVGVNVPNAAVMVVENAERFGLSQLHQLRGRVGRGENKSYCILMTKNKLAENTQKRIAVMTETQDGFVIAEEDMKLRGPGDIDGTQQSGLPINLKIAHLVRDVGVMEKARECAKKMLLLDPQHTLPANAVMWNHLKEMKKESNFSEIS